MKPEQITELARQAGMEIHPRKMQIRVGADAALGLDSTDVVMRFATLVRNATLEEAAVMLDERARNAMSLTGAAVADACADRIRSLKT